MEPSWFMGLADPILPKPPIQSTITAIFAPFRTISCQSLADDFYSNLLDWSGKKIFYCENNVIFQYNFHTGESTKVFEDSSVTVCSLKCLSQSECLVVGCSSGILIYVDLNTLKPTRLMLHRGRISALEIMENKILTGSRDRKMKMIDFRSKAPEKCYSFHTQEICGIAVNRDKRYISTGGNDNKVVILDLRRDETCYRRLEDHKAAVKALGWSPLCSTKIISGGGTADKTLKQWDIALKNPLEHSVGFESQVCNVRWLESGKVLSTFGYSNDDVKLLKNFRVERRFSGHRNRVIHFAVDGKEAFFASGSGDAGIKIWRIEVDEGEIMIR